MKETNIELNFCAEQIDAFTSRNKLYSYLANKLTESYGYVGSNVFSFILRSSVGIFKEDFEIETGIKEGDEFYFKVDYNKWITSIQKFNYADNIKLTINGKKLIKFSTDKSEDVINLSITRYEKTDPAALNLLPVLEEKRKASTIEGCQLEITNEILNDLNLASGLFISQGNVNSIGLGPEGIIYADRATILRTKFQNEIPMKFFKNLEEDEKYVYLHQYVLSLIPLIYKDNPKIYFNNSYQTIYWQTDNMELYYVTDNIELAIPTDEQLDSIIPAEDSNCGEFEVDLGEFKDAVDFFSGFFTGSAWKPITFNSVANKELTMRYKQSEADITKTLNCTSDYEGSFILESESLRKVIGRVKSRDGELLTIKFRFDNDSPGVFCNIGECCNVIFAKLEDDSEL